MIIGPKNFRDEELFVPKKQFEEQGIKVVVASATTSVATGMLKGKVKPDLALKAVSVKNYDAVIFVGGVGARTYYTSELAHRVAREAVKEGKILAAICLAPNILANAGLLRGKEATCWNSSNLKEKGAKYRKAEVVKDGRIITANGPKAAAEFGRAIIKALKVE